MLIYVGGSNGVYGATKYKSNIPARPTDWPGVNLSSPSPFLPFYV